VVRDIKIHPVLNGFVVEVGCQIVVFDSLVKLNRAIHDYFTDPEGTEKKFIDEAVNDVHDPRTPRDGLASPDTIRRRLNETLNERPRTATETLMNQAQTEGFRRK
jgi:hypothetical protein